MSRTNRYSPSLTIGALAQAAGIAVETLRTWERRYGLLNQIERDGGGQRRYLEAEVRRLRLVRRALQGGHRAASVVKLPSEQLNELLALSGEAAAPRREGGLTEAEWPMLVEAWNWSGLTAALNRSANACSAVEFLDSRLGPFLEWIGDSWANGRINIAQEHLVSECVSHFLASRWEEMNSLNSGVFAVLSTLPGERHVLGLHMAAWTLASCGAKVLFLGADTPVAEIHLAVKQVDARMLVLSASAASTPSSVQGQLGELLDALPRGVAVCVGGAAVQGASLPRLDILGGFAQLQSWFRRKPPYPLGEPSSGTHGTVP